MSNPGLRGAPATRGRTLFCIRAAILLTGITVAAVACAADEIGSPLSIELTGPGTGVAGEPLSVLYDVKGRSLLGVIFDWGDGAVDSLGTARSQSAAGSMQHTYLVPGHFTVRAQAEDATEGAATAHVSIDVAGG